MAFPIIPAIIGALVLMAAGGKKKGGRPPFLPPSDRLTWLPPDQAPPAEGGFTPGAPCPGEVLQPGEYGGYDESGNCVVFWNSDTRSAFAQTALQIQAEKGYTMDEMCAGGDFIPGQGTVNPILEQMKKLTLSALYGVTATYWPPQDASPYWIKATWQSANAAMLYDVCGYPTG